MNPGQVVGLIWTVLVWFFILSVFVFPITLSYWRANERRRAEETEKVLKSCGFDTSGEHIYDA